SPRGRAKRTSSRTYSSTASSAVSSSRWAGATPARSTKSSRASSSDASAARLHPSEIRRARLLRATRQQANELPDERRRNHWLAEERVAPGGDRHLLELPGAQRRERDHRHLARAIVLAQLARDLEAVDA